MEKEISFLLFFGFFIIKTLSQSGEEPEQATEFPFVTGKPYEIGFSTCSRFHGDGRVTSVTYDECTSFCCGGIPIDNSMGLQCCGSDLYGSPYHPKRAKCCEWWTGHGKAYRKSSFAMGFGCCGAELIFWGVQSCCYGYPDPPEVFYHQRQLCCNSHRTSIRTTYSHQSSCCGMTASFDHRLQACPCGDGRVLNIRQSRANCCETPEGLKTPYILATDICCNGEVGQQDTHFCCGESIGRFGEQVCCSDKLFLVDPPNENLTACCNGEGYDPRFYICCDDLLREIDGEATQCCGEIPFNAEKSICCEGNLWSTDTEGTECCSRFSFFPGKGSFCCNGDVLISEVVGGDQCCGFDDIVDFYYEDEREFICCDGELHDLADGDTCCQFQPYFSAIGVCCDGETFDRSLGESCCNGNPYNPAPSMICCENGPFGPFKSPKCCNGEGYDVEGGTVCCGDSVFGKYKWPACCVDQGYDAFTHTCCGATIQPNPNESNQVSCCGDLPYDRKTELCCDGFNITVPKNIPLSRAQCCDISGVYDSRTQLCCYETIFNKTNRFNSRCCGGMQYDITEQLCCEPEDFLSEPSLNDFEYGNENTKCCGSQIFNTNSSFCCNGFLQNKVFEETGCCAGRVYDRTQEICCNDRLRNIGSFVPWTQAICCGNECMYMSRVRCCNDRMYIGNTQTNQNCEMFSGP